MGETGEAVALLCSSTCLRGEEFARDRAAACRSRLCLGLRPCLLYSDEEEVEYVLLVELSLVMTLGDELRDLWFPSSGELRHPYVGKSLETHVANLRN